MEPRGIEPGEIESREMELQRIPPLEPPYEAGTGELLHKMMSGKGDPLKLFRTLAHHPRLMKRFSTMGGGILSGGLVHPLERELLIHRTTALCGAEYEWGVHAAFFGRPLGFSEEQLRGTVNASWDDPMWSARQSLLIRLADGLHHDSNVHDDLWRELAENWSTPELIEMVLTVGFYHLVSFAANAMGVSLEDFGERFPVEDGYDEGAGTALKS